MKKAIFYKKFSEEFKERTFDPNETLLWLSINQTIKWSWGFQKPFSLFNSGLIFQVNGHHHKGFVLITLACNDTYTVRFLNFEYEEVKEKLTNVYCDELQEKIDIVIEKNDIYEN